MKSAPSNQPLHLNFESAVIAGLGMACAAASALGAWRWTNTTRDLAARLEAGALPPRADRHSEAGFSGLPAPVQRYFRAALTDGQQIVSRVTLTQSGTFNLSAIAARWKPFTAIQKFTTSRPGFVWNARIMMFPGVSVRVVDAYIAGEGLLRPAILGLFDMGTMQGKGEIARGELMRHFAESLWFPTALLPSQGVVWQAVDDGSATATMSDGPISVTMLFHFGADGLIAAIHADGRATTLGTQTVLMPWEGRMSNYQTRNGMRIPLTAEVMYITPQGEKPYFKGRIDTITYEFAL